jgi:DNA-binding protein HU-beta
LFMRFSMGGSPVNKNDLVALVADAAGLSKIDATKAVDAVFDGIIQSLKKGEEVRLVGFGTFDVSDRAASEGRNPRTGEKINIPASKQPKFKAGKTLKDALN